MVHPDDREAAWQVMHDYFATRGAGTYENTLRLRTKQGQWRWITSRGKALFDRDGNPTRFVGFNTDIEHRKKTEDSLRKLSRAVEQSHGTILITDLEPRIEFVNPAFTRITGYQPSEVIGRNPSLLKSGHHDEAFYQDMWQTLCAGEEWSGEILNRAKDGTLFWEYCIISPVRDEEGKITHYVAIKENISSRKEAEQQLIDAKKAAEAANLAKSAFLANMSHELRTPLNAISGFAQLLLNAPQLPEEQRDHVRRIVRGGDYLLTLINDILDLSKIEVGRIELHPENLDLANFFRDVAEMIQLRAEQKGLTFEYQGDASLPGRVQADPKRLRQVLLNLLGNATKFTDSGFVRLTAQYQSDQLVLVIEDSGPGISPQDMPRIFDPFVQTGEDQYKSQGTGLGLSITHRIVKLMEGTIKADSKLGQGTRFEVRLPLEKSYQSLQRNHKEAASGGLNAEQISGYRRIPAAEQDQPDPSEGEPEPLRLMVVDDIPSNRVMLTYFLQPLGFEVVEADDGETCLKMAPEFEPDLVFMDMRMPGLNGLQTMAKLRAMPMFRELPVVIVSASVFHQDQATAIDQGATAYLHKPVDLTSLLTTLKQYLPIEWVLAKPEAEQTPQQQATPSRYPPQWLAELQQALSMGNGKRLRTLLEERKKSGEFVPAILFAWVDGYDHHQIQEWLAQQRDSGGKEER
jgi:PAS domain S-box-containing protein